MYPEVRFSGFFITSIAIAIAILFLFDYSPLFAANFSEKKSSNASTASTDDLGNSSSFRKSLASAFKGAISNASASQALAARNHPHGSVIPGSLTLADDIVYDEDKHERNRIQLWASPSNLEREKLNRSESGVPIQVEDPLATKREPKWHNACMKHSVFNDTLIKIIIGMQSPHPTLAIEEDRKASGTFIKMENGRPTILATNQRGKLLRPIRPKRGVKKAGVSLSLLEQQQELKQSTSNVNDDADSDHDDDDDVDADADESSLPTVLGPTFGRSHQVESNKNKQPQPMGPLNSFRHPKQNSLYLTSSEISELTRKFGRHIMKRSREVSSKSRNYHNINNDSRKGLALSSDSQKSPPANQALAAVLNRIGANATNQLTKVMDKIFVSDVRISWSINCALNNANSAKKILGPLIRVMKTEIENNRSKLDEEQTEQLVENQHEWLANFSDVEVKNEQASRVVETRKLFANVSHYMQFVAVALEQMLYEQSLWDRQFAISYNDLERATLKILCEIDTLCQLLQSLKEGKEELVKLMEVNKLTDENLHAFETMRKINASSVESIGKRIFYSKDLLNSVYFDWLRKEHKPRILLQQKLLHLQAELTNKQQQNGNNSSNSSLSTEANGSSNTWLEGSFLSNLTNNLVSPSMIRISRQVMPIRERNLKSYAERLVRDKSMLENYEKVLSFYMTILTNVFV